MNTTTQTTNTETAATPMTDYGKRKLNGVLKVFLADNTEKNRLDRKCKAMTSEIKGVLAGAGLTHYEGGGCVVTLSEQSRMVLDEEKIRKLLGGTIPADCYTPSVSVRMTVRAA